MHYHGWDVSYETTPPRDKERQYQIERAFLLDKTMRVADRIVQGTTGKEKTNYGTISTKYVTPEQISAKINQKIRAEKEDEKELF